MTRRWVTFFAASLLVAATAGVSTAQQESIEELRARAEQGDASAQYTLGGMYADGNGVPEDDVEAAHWFTLAAEQENARAQYNLGAMYEYGEGVPQNATQAVSWYRAAAEQGMDYLDCHRGTESQTGLLTVVVEEAEKWVCGEIGAESTVH